MRREVLEALRERFRPEFLNRVDETIVFHSLTADDLERVVDIQMERLKPRLAERKIVLELTEAARRHFARAGYDPVYGARPLRRLLQKELETALGRRILEGTVREGSRVVVDVGEGGELTFTSHPLAEAA